MNNSRKKQVVLLLVVVVVALMAIMAAGAAALDKPPPGPPNPPIVPPHANAFGMTYDELAIAWWQWAGTVEVENLDDHPLVADGEMDCSLGQEGKVWFLGGTFGHDATGTADRECDVPVGKALFFPIINIICSPFVGDVASPDPTMTFEEFLLACAVNPGDVYGFELEMNPVSASIDGVEIPKLEKYYVEPGVTFDIGPVPDPNIFYADEGAVEPAATTGYYLLLPPLSEGDHTIAFEGEFTGDYSSYYDITYLLHVK